MRPLVQKALYHGSFAALGIALIFGILLLQSYSPQASNTLADHPQTWSTQLPAPISAPQR